MRKRRLFGALTAVMAMCLAVASGVWAVEADVVAIDESNFPDPVFRQYVSDNFDTNNDGSLSDAEMKSVEHIYVSKIVKILLKYELNCDIIYMNDLLLHDYSR